jgi:AraC-like DNA-binding protein
MVYSRHIPSAPLNAFIDDLYYLDDPSPLSRLKVLPMPSLHLMVNLGPAFQVYDADHTQPFATCIESWCVGLWSRYHIVNWPPNAQFFGIHFKPGGTYPFLGLPLSELHNQIVSLDALWGCVAAEIRERLYAAPTIQAGFALLEHLLLAHLSETEAHGLDVVQHAIDAIVRRHGSLSIRALSDHIGISQNHLGTLFKKMVGVTPKELARFYRFEHVLSAIDPAQPVDWTQLARRSHFYDQSHFNKDFVAFTGHTPGDYMRLRDQMTVENPGRNLTLGQLPTD